MVELVLVVVVMLMMMERSRDTIVKGCVRMLMTKFSIVQAGNAKITQCGLCFECDNVDD